MLKLEEITVGAEIAGLLQNELATIVAVNKVGDNAVTVYYKTHSGAVQEQLLFRENEEKLSIAETGLAWSFESPSKDFKLALEALRIRMGFLFDPMMAIHTSNVEPLPHQISAVYEAMLPKQPLRFVLADDPGAGKTIMAGLLIKELLMRADAQRILIVAPGSLTEQWQDEMRDKFTIDFKLFSREQQELSSSGNYFNDENLLIARVDQLARAEDLQQKLQATHWDLIIVDEAHKLSAHRFGNKVDKTQRYELGELLGRITRHFLLMTATPHNGKEDDFRLWLALLDSDRFYGDSRDDIKLDVSDVMRRMVKEELLKFDGTRLFPERRAYTVNYRLSEPEASLYGQVTQYVVEEMNRAERLDKQRKGQVGFALTMLQRRLASSPEAIYQSLRRRKERLEKQLREMKIAARSLAIQDQKSLFVDNGFECREPVASYYVEKRVYLPENPDDMEDDLSPEEYEQIVDKVIDRSTAAETVQELEREIQSLKNLEAEAEVVINSGKDCKWEKLSEILQDQPEMHDSSGARRKLIIFTEHRDTLNYLQNKISGLLGSAEAVRVIHGSTNRDTRKQIQEGRQVYIVYPLIQESEKMDIKNLEDGYLHICEEFPEYKVSKVHGKMKPAEKEEEMQRFLRNETQIMVATTVIEVGVNVPNASVMVIENAERFGLSQLHQLRGRVGRGADQSYCILVTGYKLTEETRKRIEIMVQTNDGFEIAEADLKLRGPGDLEGTQQSGVAFDLKIADIARDGQLLQYVRDIAERLLDEDPDCVRPENAVIWQQLKELRKKNVNWAVIS